MAEDDFDDLTNAQLALKLKDVGMGGMPVTATTRQTLIKKLRAISQGSVNQSRTQTDDSNSPTKSPGRSRRRNSSSPARNKSPSRQQLHTSVVDNPSPPPAQPVSRGRTSPTRSTRRSTARRSSDTENDDLNSSDSSSRFHPAAIESSPPRYRANTSSNSNSIPGLGINDAFARRMTAAGSTNSSANSTPTQLSNDDYRPSFLSTSSSTSPFRSDFLRQIASGRASIHSRSSAPTPSTATSNIITSSNLLDVKESDDEDAGQPRTYTKFSQGASKYAVTQSKSSSRGRGFISNDGWRLFRSDSPASAGLLIVFFLFFIAIAFIYINMHAADSSMMTPLDLHFPHCGPAGSMPGKNCLREDDKEWLSKIYAAFAAILQKKLSELPCKSPSPLFIADSELISLIVEQDRSLSFWVVETQLPNLKTLLQANYMKLKIQPARDGISVEDTQSSLYCSILATLTNAAHWFFTLAIGLLVVGVIFISGRYWLQREARHREEVFKLVSHIVDIVSSKTQGNECFIPISHVRDQLIPPKERSKLAKLWEDAVEVLDHDSRLRREIQQVEGEQFYVWRWVASSLTPNKKKVWQGQAFDTVEGSVNSLQHSPTSCLKIRHMFDADQEEGDEWVTTVVDAILEKCGKAKILHLVVDRQSKEGCVYMKCASPTDAGIAYHALHGSWFASNLVTVRYIREARYLERFPDSAKCIKPLRPSNDSQSSLLMPVF